MDFNKLNFIIQRFFINSKVLDINIINRGLINNTYIVEHLYNGTKSKFILQSLSDIFESHEAVNINHKLITDHIEAKIKNNSFDFGCKNWEIPSLIRCKSNKLFHLLYDSEYWRAMKYIDKTCCFDSLEDFEMAYQTGLGLAKFHLLCTDLDYSKLENSIEHFHDTSHYINQYILTINNYDFAKLDDEVKKRIECLTKSISNQIGFASLLLKSLRKKSLPKNVIHGDPKLCNFLFETQCKKVVSLVDLDTVSAGYLLTDLADCIRSICNSAGQNPQNTFDISFDISSCMYFLDGYFSLNKIESFRYLPESIYLIIFELTIRFLTDFLQFNKYFKIQYETHNLFRAEVQFELLSSFLLQMPNFSKELYKIGVSTSLDFLSDAQKFV